MQNPIIGNNADAIFLKSFTYFICPLNLLILTSKSVVNVSI